MSKASRHYKEVCKEYYQFHREYNKKHEIYSSLSNFYAHVRKSYSLRDYRQTRREIQRGMRKSNQIHKESLSDYNNHLKYYYMWSSARPLQGGLNG